MSEIGAHGTPEAATVESHLPGTIAKLRAILADFSAPTDGTGWFTGHRVSLNDSLALPDLARLVLSIGASAVPLPYRDKTRWGIAFRFEDRECIFALQKFGPRLHIERLEGEAMAGQIVGPVGKSELTGGLEDLVDRILERTNRAVKTLEKDFLRGAAKTQLRDGAVTIANEYATIRAMYEYFRTRAEELLCESDPPTEQPDSQDPLSDLLSAMSQRAQLGRESFFNRVAAVTSFFSMLEHVLVLMLAFHGFDPAEDDLLSFIGDKWSAKWKRIFPLDDPTSKRLYDQLVDVAERHRNFFAHGGFGKAGVTLHFHLPGVGALPVALSDVSDVPTFQIPAADHDAMSQSLSELFAVLDGIEVWLATGPASLAMKYIDHGLSVPFDDANRQSFYEAMLDADAFDRMLAGMSYAEDRWHNFEG